MAERAVTLRISATDNFSDVMRRYNTSIGQADDATTRAGNAARRQQGVWSQLGGEMRGALVGLGVIGVSRFAVDFQRLGQSVGVASQNFDALSQSVLGMDGSGVMQRLRDATGGIVTDFDLMAGANRLLAMNLTNSTDQLTEMTSGAIRLGMAFGKDAKSAVEEFSLLMANQSYLRLDTFGISAAAVRDRMAELKREFPAITKEAAFFQATLDEMDNSLSRLGDSATAAETPFTKLEVRIANFKNQAAENFAIGVNSIIGGMEAIVDVAGRANTSIADVMLNPGDAARRAAIGDTTRGIWEQFGAGLNQMTSITTMAGAPYLADSYEELQRIVEAAARYQELTGETARSTQDIERGYSDIHGRQVTLTEGQQALVDALMNYNRSLNIASDGGFGTGAARRAQELRESLMRVTQDPLEMERMLNPANRANVLVTNIARSAAEAARSMGEYASNVLRAADGARNVGRMLGIDTETHTGAAAARLQSTMEGVAGWVSNAASNALAMADQWVRAADAAERMSLADVFGQTTGGRLGEITDALIGLGNKEGMGADPLSALQRAMDLASGRETSGSLAMQDQLLPMLLQIGIGNPDMAAQSASLYSQNVGILAALGISPDVMAANTLGLAGLTGMTNQNQRSFAGRYAMTADEDVARLNTSGAEDLMARLTSGASDFAGRMGESAEQAGIMRENVDGVKSAIDDLVSGVKTIAIDLQVNIPPAFRQILDLLNGGGLTAAIATATRDNGGVAPGTTSGSRGSTSGNTRNR